MSQQTPTVTAATSVRATDPAAGRPLSLAQLAPGASAVVLTIASGTDAELAASLVAAGLWEGAEVECLGAAPFGDPLRYRLHGYRLALRRSEAAAVWIGSPTGSSS